MELRAMMKLGVLLSVCHICPALAWLGSAVSGDWGDLSDRKALQGIVKGAAPSTGKTCGNKNTISKTMQIIGGSAAARGSWPWLASLQFYDQWTGYHNHVCGATLISDQWGVTAAHCIDARLTSKGRDNPALYKFILGAGDLFHPSGVEQVLSVDKFIVHEGWLPDREAGFPHDIALVRLSAKVDLFGMGVGVSCLPDKAMDISSTEECWMQGWGLTTMSGSYPSEALQEVKTQVRTWKECAKYVGDDVTVLPSHLCAGDPNSSTGPNACKGDSGGPLSCRRGQQWYAMGVYSWSYHSNCRPSIFTRMASYRDWINTHTHNQV